MPSFPWQMPVDLSQSYFGLAKQDIPAGHALLKINKDFPHSTSEFTQRYSLPGLGLGCGTQTSLPRHFMLVGHMRIGIGVTFAPKMELERLFNKPPVGAGAGDPARGGGCCCCCCCCCGLDPFPPKILAMPPRMPAGVGEGGGGPG